MLVVVVVVVNIRGWDQNNGDHCFLMSTLIWLGVRHLKIGLSLYMPIGGLGTLAE